VAAIGALICVGLVYETAEHGGELVYSYAGGVGIRTGDEKDIERLLLAGYYHQAMADRKAGRSDSAAQLIAAAASRYGGDPEVRLLAAESLLLDQKNAKGAIDALSSLDVTPQLRVRKGMLQADAFEALGQKDAAIALLQTLVGQTPNPRVQQRIDQLQGKAPATP
jgi:predicted Zn-dependent protease